MFPILNELENNSLARTAGVVAASIGAACITYLLAALAGYLSFGDHVTGNIVSMCTLPIVELSLRVANIQ